MNTKPFHDKSVVRRNVKQCSLVFAFRDTNIGKAAGKMKADPLGVASSAVLVLCLNLGRTYTPSIVEEKAKRASK